MKECAKCNSENMDSAAFCSLCLEKFPGHETHSEAAVGTGGFGGEPPPLEQAPPPLGVPKEEPVESHRVRTLAPTMDLINKSFSFFSDNIKTYLILALIFLVMSAAPVVVFMATVARRASSSLNWEANIADLATSGGIVVALLLLFSGLGFFSHMIATVAFAKGEKPGLGTILGLALVKLSSFTWIAILQGAASMSVLFVLVGLAVATFSPVIMLMGMIVGSVAAVVLSTWFAFAGFIFIDKDVRGTAALAASKNLVDNHLKGAWWRISVFFLLGSIAQSVPVVGGFVTVFIIVPLTAIYLWFLYGNLKDMAGSHSTLAETVDFAAKDPVFNS